MIPMTSKMPEEMFLQNEPRLRTEKLLGCLTVNKWTVELQRKAQNSQQNVQTKNQEEMSYIYWWKP